MRSTTRSTILRPWLTALLLAAAGGTSEAQTPPQELRAATPATLVEEGDRLHDGLRPLEALRRFERALARDERHYDALWRSARESVALGMLTVDEGESREWYRMAEGYARRAVEARHDGSAGHEWLAIALGRRALTEGPRERARLAVEIRQEALAALAADSLSPGAHHVLGRWHGEIRGLPGLKRFVAARFMGARIMEEASWEAAELHLRRAAELAPGTLIHHLELARVLAATDRREQAREHLRRVMELPAAEPTDALHKQEAQELLRELR